MLIEIRKAARVFTIQSGCLEDVPFMENCRLKICKFREKRKMNALAAALACFLPFTEEGAMESFKLQLKQSYKKEPTRRTAKTCTISSLVKVCKIRNHSLDNLLIHNSY